MSWLFPGFLVGAAAIALPILLHLLRRRPKRTIYFPSLRFLAPKHPQSEKQQRLLRWIVLLLRCAALALLAAAFARPFFGSTAANDREATVVVVDNSFSLQTRERWPVLRAWALEQIGTPGAQDKMGVLVMGSRPAWVAPLNTPAPTARAAFERLVPAWETTRADAALRLAADALAATPADQRRIIFVGDHQQLSWAGFDFTKKFPAGVTAVFPKLPAPVTRQAALQPPTVTRQTDGFHAALGVRNFTGAQTRTLRVFRDGGTVAIHQQSLALAERESRTLQIDLPAGAAVEFAHFRFALDEDDLPADDNAYAVWQAAGDRVVLLDPAPAGAADYLGAALAAAAELKPALRVQPMPAATWPANAVAVLRNDGSFAGEAAARLEAFLRGGGAALVFVGGGPAQTTWLANIAGIKLHALKVGDTPAQVRDWAMDHPLVAAMSAHSVNALLGWDFQRAWGLPASAVDPLALWSDNGAALGETSVGAGKMLLCGFTADRRDSEWPVREMFVPFVHRSVAHLLGTATGGPTKPALVSAPLTLPVEPGQWRALDGPTSGAPSLAVQGIVTPAAPGVYEFNSGATRRLFAVNLAAEESDPALWTNGTPWLDLSSPGSAATTPTSQLTLAAIEAEQRSALWWWALAGVAVLMLAELGVANRTAR